MPAGHFRQRVLCRGLDLAAIQRLGLGPPAGVYQHLDERM
jgi:hypothetical protein